MKGKTGTGVDSPGKQPDESAKHGKHIPPEIDQNSSQSADMHRNVYQQTLIRAAGKGRGQDKVAR
ncbi:hypothetical protein MACH01_33380 [Thalassospira tepidiphila]|nr:hypothetical protein MACH01_33380 [Thalassospira tepidiphila]